MKSFESIGNKWQRSRDFLRRPFYFTSELCGLRLLFYEFLILFSEFQSLLWIAVNRMIFSLYFEFRLFDVTAEIISGTIFSQLLSNVVFLAASLYQLEMVSSMELYQNIPNRVRPVTLAFVGSVRPLLHYFCPLQLYCLSYILRPTDISFKP